MESIEAVAAENASVFDVLPADGRRSERGRSASCILRSRAAGHRPLDFALDGAAAVTGTYSLGALQRSACARRAGEAAAPLGSRLHNVRNAVAASLPCVRDRDSATGHANGLRDFRPLLRAIAGAHARERRDAGSTTAKREPDSVHAAIDRAAAAGTDTLLVLGDMGEVGEQGPDFHLEVGRYAAASGVRALYALGEQTAHAVAGFGAGARHFATIDELIAAARAAAVRDATLLVKGSRFMRMERVVAALAGNAGGH